MQLPSFRPRIISSANFLREPTKHALGKLQGVLERMKSCQPEIGKSSGCEGASCSAAGVPRASSASAASSSGGGAAGVVGGGSAKGRVKVEQEDKDSPSKFKIMALCPCLRGLAGPRRHSTA